MCIDKTMGFPENEIDKNGQKNHFCKRHRTYANNEKWKSSIKISAKVLSRENIEIDNCKNANFTQEYRCLKILN